MKDLYPRFSELVLLVAHNLMPHGFDLTHDETECNTLDKITRYYSLTGNILVWTGASDSTIFGHARYNHTFRAWHDWVHVFYGIPFTLEGERIACQLQQKQVEQSYRAYGFSEEEARLFCLILEAEIVGQAEHHARTGEFVHNQREFTQNYVESEYDR